MDTFLTPELLYLVFSFLGGLLGYFFRKKQQPEVADFIERLLGALEEEKKASRQKEAAKTIFRKILDDEQSQQVTSK